MKAMVCEMCNGHDFVKQDGMFVCQSCGTKYSIEEAKKLMIEGTVDVQGTVKIDNNDFVQKQLANARRAKQKEDWEETEKYYNLVEQNDPTNIEAIFYSAYAKARQSLVINDIYKRQSVFNAFNKSISIIDDNYDINDENSIILLDQITNDVFAMTGSSFVYTERTNGYGVKTDNSNETHNLFRQLIDTYIAMLYEVAKKYGNDKKHSIAILERILSYFKQNFDAHTFSLQQKHWHEKCVACCQQIKALDPSYNDSFLTEQKQKIEKANKKENRGCLIFGLVIVAVIVISCIIIICLP